MKKKIIGGIAVMAIAAIAAFNVNFNNSGADLTKISLANVEALANGENGWITCKWAIWYSHCAERTDGYYCSPCGGIM